MSEKSLKAELDLSGKVALVTGAGRGIGEAIALRLAEAGAAVVVGDLDAELATTVADRIVDGGGRACGLLIDVGKAADADRAMTAAVAAFGDLDILVNNAAIFPPMAIMDITEAQWDKVQDINLKGLFFFSQAAARAMMAKKHGGKIINITSLGYKIPPGMLGHYDASKGGVTSVTQSLAKELGPHGICVNAVAPGIVMTPGGELAAAKLAQSLTVPLDTLPVRSVLGRYGNGDDIAKAVYFLASGLADYVTGSVVEVGGGYQLI